MINQNNNIKFILLTIAVLFMTIPLKAQLKRNGLIFSEVYLNDAEPERSWIEIYNPTDEKLILENFSFYRILTPNVLPQEIQEKGGIEISPGTCIVLCANESMFNFQIDAKSMLIQVSLMRNFGKGGFFSLGTKKLEEDGEDIFCYGDPEITSKLKNQSGYFVVPFSTDAKSFTRIKNEPPEEQFLPNFTETEPSPGLYLEKGDTNGQ